MTTGYTANMSKAETMAALTPWLEATHLHDCAASEAQIDAEVVHLRAIIANLRRRCDRLQAGHDAGLAARGALLDRAIRRIVAGRP
jgi:hypothetical protein